MAKVRGQISLEPSVWDDQAEGYLKKVWKGSKSFLSDTRQDVKEKKASLYKAVYESKVVGCLVIRVEKFKNGSSDLVMVAASGRVKEGSLLDTFLPELPKIAKLNGCTSVRMHTSSKAVMNFYEKHGYEEAERIYKKEVC